MSLGLWFFHYQKIELQGFSSAFQLFCLNIFLLTCLVPEFRYLRCVCLGLQMEHVFPQVLLFNITAVKSLGINLYLHLLVLIATLLSGKFELVYTLIKHQGVRLPIPSTSTRSVFCH